MVSGAAVVRAFGDESRVLAVAEARVDDANRALYYLWQTNQWLRVAMNMVGSLVSSSNKFVDARVTVETSSPLLWTTSLHRAAVKHARL